ncbi:primosomal protein N' family DNA-binding protein [Nigerium massiliense]|uniref:primosomal protein N' family DNA-binding protein n=1 Tax=Nigerium massiliense TaxID=1522317 RepID=UPI00058E878D|nr:hypothetical protein [Nigerium massiliense]
MTEPTTPLVARVAVDMSLPHLDRPFDYLVPEVARDAIAVGCRVRVRFAGRLRDGFVLGLGDDSDADAKLRPLERVVSSEVVLSGPVARLCREVADHYAGTFADVARLAVPGRHATTEKAKPTLHPDPDPAPEPTLLPAHPEGEAFLAELAAGNPVRAAWNPAPVFGPAGDWAAGVCEALGATLASGRRGVIVVPDADALDRLVEVVEERFGAGSFVTLSADLGPAARYRSFLAAARGNVRIVLGTRAAVYAPVPDLGLLVVVDDGNDTLSEPRAPYPHAREVAALRASVEHCALLFASYQRTAEVQALVAKGWLVPLALPFTAVRREGPLVRVASDTDRALDRDPAAFAARLPHDVFAVLRQGLASGPVLVQVPRAGYVSAVSCQTCREPARCPRCGQTLRGERDPAAGLRLVCPLCGPLRQPWRCDTCGDTRLRAPRVGVTRTAEELSRAFPGTAVVQSWSGHPVDAVGESPAIVLATPGSEPRPAAGYAAAVLLDSELLLTRPELRAAEEALRRWLTVCSLVRPGGEGGSVIAVGPADARALQALVRLDAPGFAERELAERAAASMPPVAKLVVIEGPADALPGYDDATAQVPGRELFGPLELSDDVFRLTLRAPASATVELLAGVKAESSRRSSRKVAGAVRVRVDPQVID